MPTITISTDKKLLNIERIQALLATSYWANNRSLKDIQTTIDNSRCYGLYLDELQIGFARLISDHVTFAYLMDVIIDESHRGQGLSKRLLQYIFSEADLQNVNKWYLRTADAHSLYKKFGFTALEKPEMSMEKNYPAPQILL